MKNNNNQEQEETTLVAPLPNQENAMTPQEAPKLDKILPAIAKAKGRVKIIGKSEKHTGKGGGYDFASIDDFLELVNPICAEEGLIFNVDEHAIEDFTKKGQYGETSWMRITFRITAYHISGQSMPPVQRTVEVLRNGAQAYGSAQSYALKQYLRALLLIPTGDKDDADHRATDAGPVAANSTPSNPAKTTPKQQREYDNKPVSAAHQKRKLEEINQDLTDCHNVDDVKKCADIWQAIAANEGWSKDYKIEAANRFKAKREELQEDHPFQEAAE